MRCACVRALLGNCSVEEDPPHGHRALRQGSRLATVDMSHQLRRAEGALQFPVGDRVREARDGGDRAVADAIRCTSCRSYVGWGPLTLLCRLWPFPVIASVGVSCRSCVDWGLLSLLCRLGSRTVIVSFGCLPVIAPFRGCLSFLLAPFRVF